MKLKTKIILLSILGTTIFLLTGVAFAYLANEIIGNESDKININALYYGNILVSYDNDYNSIDISALDLNSVSAGDTLSYMMKFNLENTGNISHLINLYWDNITNTFCQYRDDNYDCADPDATDYYVGDEIRASLYECSLTNYGLTDIITIKSLCTKVSVATDQALPLTDQKVKINNSAIAINATSNKYYVAVVDIDNLATNQNYQQGKSVELGIKVEFEVRELATAIQEKYSPESDVNLDFSYTSNGCNDADSCTAGTIENVSQVTNGLYINNKLNIVNDPTQGQIKYFRGNVNNYVRMGTYQTTIYESNGYLYDDLTICETEHDVGNCLTYISAGDPILWRVIRIDDDDSVRIITDKTSISDFFYNDPNYIPPHGSGDSIDSLGYTHSDDNANRLDGNIGYNSELKSLIDTWYTTNLLTNYGSKIKQNVEYCNDTSNTVSGNYTYFGAYIRLIENSQVKPTFSCPITTETYGGLYQLPIASITADEVVYAGGYYSNLTYYLKNGIHFDTISPRNYYREYIGEATSLYVFGNGSVNYGDGIFFLNNQLNTRAVVTLKEDTLVTGEGTIISPWIVQ